MEKTYIFLAMLVSCCFHTQINLKIKLSGVDKTATESSYIIQVNLQNTSEDFIAIPIVLTRLKGYFVDERCVDRLNFRENKILDFTAFVKYKGHNVDVVAAMSDIDQDEIATRLKEIERLDLIKQSDLRNWMRSNNISNVNLAEINKILFENILLLEPCEEISYHIIFRPESINCLECGLFYFYSLEENSEVDLSLLHCVDDSIYTYLTEDQKKKLKRYKFFSGELLSNEIKLHFSSFY